jgi:hypothetical protein
MHLPSPTTTPVSRVSTGFLILAACNAPQSAESLASSTLSPKVDRSGFGDLMMVVD